MGKTKINVVTLGCSKNVVDSEYLMAQLEANNLEVVYDSNSTDAKIVVVNTCGFIADAKEESIDTILSFAHAKENGHIDHLFVMGCLSERYKKELIEEIPEVDEFFGVNTLEQVIKVVGGSYRADCAHNRVLTTLSHYAYLKISEGCNWGCGYCAIPIIRGKHISTPIEALIAETEALAQKGVKELIVIAQDTTYYGLDIYGKRKLAELLEKLAGVEGIEWIRLHYAYPAQFPSDVIDVMKRIPKICKYLDIPFQHISDNQLSSMRRGINKLQTYELIKQLRCEIPDIALRTTLLTGYPNESDQNFAELLDFVRDVRFDRLGVFAYSEEEDTYSATSLKDNISEEVKQQRVDQIMSLQNKISLENNLKKVGSSLKVIIDRIEDDCYIARSQYDSPEVDQEIILSSDNKYKVGDFVVVKITAAEDYDLYAQA